MQSTYEQIRQTNLSNIFKIEMDPRDSKKINPNIHKNSQDKLLKRRLPMLSLIDPEDLENY